MCLADKYDGSHDPGSRTSAIKAGAPYPAPHSDQVATRQAFAQKGRLPLSLAAHAPLRE